MGRLMIAGVCQKKGITYRRFRVKLADGRWGDQYIRLPDPSDPRFAEELARVNGEVPARRAIGRGSMAALAIAFRAELANRKLAKSTRTNYLRYVELIRELHGHRLVAELRPMHVYKMRDAMAATPGKANNFLNVLKQMLEHAAKRDWRSDNPAAAVDYLEIGEHEPWPAWLLTKAIEEASPMLRLAIVTGLCSGQRVGDVVRMQHNWHDGRMMEMTQQKTGKFVAVPMHPMWTAEIAAHEKRSITLLYDRSGKPFSGPDRIQERLRRLMAELRGDGAAEGERYTFHGLRKNACCYLLELGLSDTTVGAILGMTPETVRHYGKRAHTLMIAKAAARQVTRGNLVRLTGEPAAASPRKA